MVEATQTGFIKRPGIGQFIKFCIVGASSTIITFVILNLLTKHYQMDPIPASCIAFCFAVSNGFFWNSRWTFQGVANSKKHEQFVKFVAVNLVGLTLNTIIVVASLSMFTGRISHSGLYTPLQVNGAQVIATVFVAAWNFFASRKWAFK